MGLMSLMGLMGQRSPRGQVYAHRGFLSNRRDLSSQASGHVLDSRGLDAILPLRTSMLNRTSEDFWEHQSRLVA